MVVEVVISLSVNFVGRWVSLLSNVTIILTHFLLVLFFVFCFCYPLNSNTVITTLGSYTHYSLIFSCYLSNSYTSTTTSGFSSNVGQTQAILVTPNTEDSKAWFLDSSAINHVTNKFNNLNIRSNLSGLY